MATTAASDSGRLRTEIGKSRAHLIKATENLDGILSKVPPNLDIPLEELNAFRHSVATADDRLLQHYTSLMELESEWKKLAEKIPAEVQERSIYYRKFGPLNKPLNAAATTHKHAQRVCAELDRAIDAATDHAVDMPIRPLTPIKPGTQTDYDSSLSEADPFSQLQIASPKPATPAVQGPPTVPEIAKPIPVQITKELNANVQASPALPVPARSQNELPLPSGPSITANRLEQ
ncbi:unnamed protein product [Bursaphelenchus xylophilus]|nr:unnamed protein product [Bursaphelenchus xylophilus]CAD5222476.1 unnamed protein product [Bursaphelenchus xylophilus]CAD5233679.1 unnamed protein product [Bursaphelenchus xylophilus]CAG9087569.1 unnamed protein product [Bursaphelenchus xylophilus]CAG9110411.1 unnamed protein product [Bursaphelenchus xylophilus]